MEKKKLRILISIGVLIIASTILQTLWKSGWFNQKSNELMGNEYKLVDTTNNVILTLPNKPEKTIESKNSSSNIKLSFTKYKTVTANKDQIILTIISINCDTCSSNFKSDIISFTLKESVESLGLSLKNGIEHQAGKLKGFLYNSILDGVPVKYFGSIYEDRAYFYIETIAGSDKSVSSKYFETLELNASR